MAVLTTKEKRRIKGMNPVTYDVDLGNRLSKLDSDGSYTGGSGTTNAVGDTGGVAAGDIVYESGYDATTGYIKVLPARSDSDATCRNLWYSPSAIAEGASGTVRKTAVHTSNLTNSGSVNDPVYLSDTSAGDFDATEPTATDRVVEVGAFLTTGASAVIGVDLGGDAIPVHAHTDKASGGTLTTPALTGTTNQSFTVDSDSSNDKLRLITQAGGSDATCSIVTPVMTGNISNYLPNSGGGTYVTTNATQTLTDKTLTAPAIAGSTISGTHNVVAGTTFSGTIANLGIVTTADLNGGTIDGTVIGASSAAAGTFTTATATTFTDGTASLTGGDLSSVGTLTASTITDGTVSITAGSVTGTWADLGTVTTINIDGGSVDGATIGANSAGAITGTTITGTTITDSTFSVTGGTVTGMTATSPHVGTSLIMDQTTNDAIIVAADQANQNNTYTIPDMDGNKYFAMTSAADGQITNTEVDAAAAIALSKLAAVTDGYIIVGSGASVPAAVAMSGDVTIINDGTTTLNAAHQEQEVIIRVEDLAADADISARPIFVHPRAVTLTSIGILTEGAPAGVDDGNPSVFTLADDGTNTIVTKTYNTGTQPPSADYEDLGALDGTHKVLSAGEHVTLTVNNGATANLPAFSLIIRYVPTNA